MKISLLTQSTFFTLIFSLVNLSSALKALFLFLDDNGMWFEPFFGQNICLHGNIHFICLIQIQNTEIYTTYRKSAKNIWIIYIYVRYEFVLISPSPYSTHYQEAQTEI